WQGGKFFANQSRKTPFLSLCCGYNPVVSWRQETPPGEGKPTGLTAIANSGMAGSNAVRSKITLLTGSGWAGPCSGNAQGTGLRIASRDYVKGVDQNGHREKS